MRGVLLDLDGTLIDSRRDLATATNRLLADLQLGPLPLDQICSYVGNGARTLVRRALDATDPEQRVPRDSPILRDFLSHYEAVMLETTRPFPGVMEGLDRLRSAGLGLAVVTNKPIAPTRTILDALALSGRVGVILGGDSLPTKKPDPAMLIAAARGVGLEIADCVMVGDSDVDMAAAANAGVVGIWCSYGGLHPDRPPVWDAVADRFEDVVDLCLGALSP